MRRSNLRIELNAQAQAGCRKPRRQCSMPSSGSRALTSCLLKPKTERLVLQKIFLQNRRTSQAAQNAISDATTVSRQRIPTSQPPPRNRPHHTLAPPSLTSHKSKKPPTQLPAKPITPSLEQEEKPAHSSLKHFLHPLLLYTCNSSSPAALSFVAVITKLFPSKSLSMCVFALLSPRCCKSRAPRVRNLVGISSLHVNIRVFVAVAVGRNERCPSQPSLLLDVHAGEGACAPYLSISSRRPWSSRRGSRCAEFPKKRRSACAVLRGRRDGLGLLVLGHEESVYIIAAAAAFSASCC